MWMDGTRTRRKFVKGEQSPCFQRNLNGILRLWASINFRQLRQVSNPAAEAAALKKRLKAYFAKCLLSLLSGTTSLRGLADIQ